ncbi:MAG TPA: extracellular solute-binding protein, partial [Bacillota bacterium]|nr:extracellular solute-binding protein [Bacillota bacterium]
AMTPYSYKTTVLNQLDGGSMTRGGMQVTYRFSVAKAGYYQIALKALQDGNLGVSSGKTFRLDGKIPFAELESYRFASARNWRNVVLGTEDGAFQFYLSEGEHTLTIESTVAHQTATIDRLNRIMDEINAISLLVQTITGGNADDAVDWDILKYIPDLQTKLLAFADELEVIYDELDAQDVLLDTAPQVSTLNVAAKQLRRVAKVPNRIGSKLDEFSEGSGSAYQLIGNAVSSLLSQPLSVDCIYVYQNVNLPKPMGSFFRRIWDAIRSFFYSFFDIRYNDIKVEEGTLEVWIQSSNLYLDIIQNMIDRQFTAQTGVKVQCSILTNTSKIVMSHATGDNPDVILGIDDWVPYSYALRGLLADLSQYDDFAEATSGIYANNFTPLIFDEGVYGIPETQSAFLLFYRKDVFDYLDLDVPNTWDDVINLLPILQSHQMNFYHPLGSDSAYKGYGVTSPFIYQFGGEVYVENGTSSTLLQSETVEAMRFLTSLFTVHDLPLQVSSFFEHFRSGDMPIGIATVDMYLQLKYAAPELSGQWGVSVLPGRDTDGDGTVERWSTSYGKASILLEDSAMKDEGWELIKWWNSAATQTEYMQKIKTGLGEKYLILTANMEALQGSVWDEEIKKEIVAMARWARIPAVTPGSYIVERELSAIWNSVVINRENVLVAINNAIPRINRELTRKFEEFGFQSASTDGRPYRVAMNANIIDWIPEGYHDGD